MPPSDVPDPDGALGASDGRRDVVRQGLGVLALSVREQPRIFALAVAGSALYGVMTVAQAYLLGAIVGHVVVPALRRGRLDAGALGAAGALILGVALLKVLGILGRRLGAGVMQYRLQADYRRRVTRRYLQLPLAWHAQHPTGELLSNANSDVEALWYPVAPFPFAVGVLIILVITIGALLATSVALAAVGVVVFPAIVVANVVYAQRMSPLVARAQHLRGRLSGLAHESFDGALVVKTLGREAAESDRFAAAATELRDTLVRVGRLRGTFDPLMEALPALGTLLVLLVGASTVPTATLVRVAYLFSLLAFPLRAIGWVLAELPRSVVGYQRVQRVLRATGSMPYGDAELGAPGAGAAPVAGPGAAPGAAWAAEAAAGAAVSLQDVHFAFTDAEPVLSGVELDVAAGRTVAVVGATGSGKSTLTALLVRLVDPQAGSVRVDGHELPTLRAGVLAGAAALVPQQTFLFDDTVRGNVTLGAPLPDAEVWSALQVAQAETFVRALPDGLDTLVGERGTSLSGGQRQRLALARALVRRPRLLVLDDATSSVDPHVEQEILTGLRARAAGTTVVVVAYRRATIALADEVVFLEHGRVVDRGTHADLQERNAAYAHIVTAYQAAEAAA